MINSVYCIVCGVYYTCINYVRPRADLLGVREFNPSDISSNLPRVTSSPPEMPLFAKRYYFSKFLPALSFYSIIITKMSYFINKMFNFSKFFTCGRLWLYALHWL